MHDGMTYGRNQGQGHSREVDRQSPTGLIFHFTVAFLPFRDIPRIFLRMDISKTSSFCLLASFSVQVSELYNTTGSNSKASTVHNIMWFKFH